jgi:hypothetical protein
VDPPAAVLRDVDVATRVHRNPVRLVEFTREGSRAAEMADDLPACRSTMSIVALFWLMTKITF